MLEKLTPEQEKLMDVVKQHWLDNLFKCERRMNQSKTTEFVHWLYTIAELALPEVVFCASPKACIDKLREISGEPNRNEAFSLYGGIWDYDWIAFYDYFTKINVLDNADFNKYRDYMQDSAVFAMIQMDTHCFCSDMPVDMKFDQMYRLHNEEGPAIVFSDGYEQYYWRGEGVPKRWIMDGDSITKEEIINESNLERRKIMMEILGAEVFYARLLGEMVVIDEDNDQYGKPMRLLRTAEPDPAINKHIYVLSVIDTSTDRKYDIFLDTNTFPEAAKNVWAAKASTFRLKKEDFDVVAES